MRENDKETRERETTHYKCSTRMDPVVLCSASHRRKEVDDDDDNITRRQGRVNPMTVPSRLSYQRLDIFFDFSLCFLSFFLSKNCNCWLTAKVFLSSFKFPFCSLLFLYWESTRAITDTKWEREIEGEDKRVTSSYKYFPTSDRRLERTQFI